MKLGEVREIIVYDETFVANDDSLFAQCGKIDGLTKIMTTLFSKIQADTNDEDGIAKFYSDKYPEGKIDIIKKRYAYYIAGQIGGRYDWLGEDINELHQNIGKNNSGCPEKQLKKEHF
mmetsp:Transcript_12194/g.18848  ORF Transcript_12194/g.18848 Transcript_12194/m.18848 type:complete len:118 (-) Transcript_12194:521-874(-)